MKPQSILHLPLLGKSLLLSLMVALMAFAPQAKADGLNARIHQAVNILRDKQHSDEPIPAEILAHAKGIAIFSITKAGIGVGGQGGEGIVMAHLPNPLAPWSAPSAFNVGGASIGAQLGFTQINYIIILNTEDAVHQFTHSEKTTFDAMATGTAGETTATEGVSTTELEKRELIVYKDTSGVFGGATLGGTSVTRDDSVNADAYGDSVRVSQILSGTVPAPESAKRLYHLLGVQ